VQGKTDRILGIFLAVKALKLPLIKSMEDPTCGVESMENPTQVARESMHNPMQVVPRSMARSQTTGERRRWREERRAYGIHGGSEKLLSGSRQAGEEGDEIFLPGICGAIWWAYQTRHQVVPAGIR
jgi:hypothetical protein